MYEHGKLGISVNTSPIMALIVLLYVPRYKMVVLIENPLLIGSLIMTRQRRVSHVCLIFQGKVA